MRRVKMLEYALRTERNKYLTSAANQQQQALSKEKESQAQKEADEKDKERESKEGSETSKDAGPSRKDSKDAASEEKDKEKPSAIPSDKKRLIKEQSGAANAASGRASPAPTAASDDGIGSASGERLPTFFSIISSERLA